MIEQSVGNVFEDIGFSREEAVSLTLRTLMMDCIELFIKDRGLTQRGAAAFFGVTQPRISTLVRGRIDLFSLDMLVDMITRSGVRLELVLQSGVRRVKAALPPAEGPRRRQQRALPGGDVRRGTVSRGGLERLP